MNLGEMFTISYPEIKRSAELITRRRNVSQATDLINSTFIRVQALKAPESCAEFVKWFSTCMKNDYVWSQSEFNKNNIIIGDELPMDIKEDEPQENRYQQVMVFKKSLPLHEQYLFELYYEKDLSIQTITDYLNEDPCFDMSRRRLDLMVNIIKKKLKNHKWQ